MQVLLNLRSATPQRKPQPRPKIVEADIVKLANVSSKIVAYGRLKTAQPVILYSEVSGNRQIRLDLNSAKSDFLTALASVLPEFKVDFPEEYEVWQEYFNNCGFDKKIDPLPETENQKIKLYLSRFNVYKLYFQVRNLEIRLSKHFFMPPLTVQLFLLTFVLAQQPEWEVDFVRL